MRKNGTLHYRTSRRVIMEDKFYIDYRTGNIEKNLDISFLSPETYNEVIVDEDLAGIYEYTYEDEEGRRLAMRFDSENIPIAGFSFMEESFHKKHNFTAERIVDKRMYITKKQFNEQYRR
jgi:uridine kinase